MAITSGFAGFRPAAIAFRVRALPWASILIFVGVLLAWQIVGELRLFGREVIPSPTAILGAWWENRADYPPHVAATLRVALTGYVLGNCAAILGAVLGFLVPPFERLSRLTSVVLFCVPVVVIIPILGIALDGEWPKIVVTMLLVFFPTLVSTRLGLMHAPGDAVAVVHASGGGSLSQLRLVRLRAALPDILAGLQIAAPAAILGAMLGEFLGGRYGLGLYLIGTMTRGQAAMTWAVGLTATALSITLFGLIGLMRRVLRVERARPNIDLLSTQRRKKRRNSIAMMSTSAWSAGGLGFLLLLWFGFIWWTGLSTVLMNSPIQVIQNLVTGPNAADNWATLSPALATSLSIAAIGSVAGIGCAFILGVLLGTFTSASKAVLPFAFISQTIPLVALAPLIATLFGRGATTTIVVTVSVTFFPSLVTIMQGIASAPQGPAQVLRSVNARPWTVLRTLTLPNAVPHLLAAVRLSVPMALTGVILAEQLITGDGLGGVLNLARGSVNYAMMWNVAVIATLLSATVYAIAQGVEESVLKRRA